MCNGGRLKSPCEYNGSTIDFMPEYVYPNRMPHLSSSVTPHVSNSGMPHLSNSVIPHMCSFDVPQLPVLGIPPVPTPHMDIPGKSLT